MNTKRTFLAISIPSGTEFPALVGRLKKNLPHEKFINYCRPENIHLTLKFLGSAPVDDIPNIIEACRAVAKKHQPFTDLENDLLDTFDELGYLRDRQNFVPHLTVCRIKSLVDKQFFMQIYNSIEQKTYLHADVKELVYFQSFLQPTGPIYKVLAKMPLGA